MSNAPKWSRDLTKLLNPEADNDWRLLASRLGYSNDDIRGWATQHDPCMALLSEWYATHKTSEANYGVLNALTEMDRMDGVAIVENAMKVAGALCFRPISTTLCLDLTVENSKEFLFLNKELTLMLVQL